MRRLEFRAIQSKAPERTIGAIKAGKGLDRYITGEHAWHQEFSMRHAIDCHETVLPEN